jgi:hypothetical protein
VAVRRGPVVKVDHGAILPCVALLFFARKMRLHEFAAGRPHKSMAGGRASRRVDLR